MRSASISLPCEHRYWPSPMRLTSEYGDLQGGTFETCRLSSECPFTLDRPEVVGLIDANDPNSMLCEQASWIARPARRFRRRQRASS
jgi:hypothetical protein